jgi:class 3 adenylate cyclase
LNGGIEDDKNGKRFPVMAHVSPIKSSQGIIIAAIEVFRDISKEEELRVLQEKFNNLIRKYVSTATVERVMAQVLSGKESNSRRRDLTILYLDVVQFTSLAEKYSPEEIANILNELFGICELITKECFGDIDKFIGDAVMAVFRRPVAALRTMLSAQEMLKWPADGSRPLTLKAGVHTGPCIAVTLNDRLDYFGSTVNMAARLESLSTGEDVVISRALFDDPEVREFIANEKLQCEPFEMLLKGFQEERFALWRVSRPMQKDEGNKSAANSRG